MYELKRKPKIHEELKIGDDTLVVDLSVEEIAKEFNARRNDLIRAEIDAKRMQSDDPKIIEQYGIAITELFKVVFGVEQTGKIVDFYEGNYTEMITEVLPFILSVIMPQITEAVSKMREQSADLYKSSQAAKLGLNRKQRRKIGL